MIKVIFVSLLALGATATAPVSADEFTVAELRELDKVTARVTTLEVPVGKAVEFGTLQITVDVCDKRPPEETPESAAFLRVVEQRAQHPETEVFSGWMFASSPGLSAMQHPVYDLWVLDCIGSLASASSSASGEGAP